MEGSMIWEECFKEGKEIIVASSSKDGIPNANIVTSLGLLNDRLLFANCQMNNTINNLKENKAVCIIGGHFRIKGMVEIHSSGKYFDLCVDKTKEYSVKDAILVNINNVFDLDRVELVR